MKRVDWFNKHPVALVNVVFIFFMLSLFLYQAFRPLDVLENWSVTLTEVKEWRVVDGKRYPVYHPNDTLLFKSGSRKLTTVTGVASRTLVCEPTDKQGEQEIQLDTIPLAKQSGVTPERDNAIIMPDVAQYNGLPRICKLTISATYQKVALWRNHAEYAETEFFIVEEVKLTPRELKEEIDRLKQRIQDLESQQITYAPAQTENKQELSQSTRPEQAPETPLIDSPAYPEPRKSIVDGLIDNVNNLIGGLL